MATEADALRYPIGHPHIVPGSERRAASIEAIRSMPGQLAASLDSLTPVQLATPYRDGGWTVQQVAHHVADSHLNATMRLRFALTEDWPKIQSYDEALWAELSDARALEPSVSVRLLASLHERWTAVLEGMSQEDWERGYEHPQMGRVSLEQMTQLYAWHGAHHIAHIMQLRTRRGW